MKTIDHSYMTIKKTVCPFCCYGCDFGIICDDFGIKGVEYIKEGSTGGRLCPRGSGAVWYLDHAQRISMPQKKNRAYEWTKIFKDLRRIIAKPDQVAITFDRNITKEEYSAITGFCNELSIEDVASSYMEPESLLKRCGTASLNIADIRSAEIILLIGDTFGIVPMSSKPLIEWKLADRKHRLIVIDSLHTHTSSFATDFLKVPPGVEALLLLALAHESIPGIEVDKILGIGSTQIKNIGAQLKDAAHGLIIASLPFARSFDPLLFVEGIKRIGEFTGKKIIPFVEFNGYEGKKHFGSVLAGAKNGKIKQLINFGELFPFYYPQILSDLKKTEVIATSPIKHNGYTTIPVALNLEKQGTINTVFGTRSLDRVIDPASGVRDVTAILNGIKETSASSKLFHEPDVTVDIKTRGQKIAEQIRQPKKKKSVRLFGEKVAYYFLGFLEKGSLRMNPYDAQSLGIRAGDIVSVKSKQGKTDLKASLTMDVDQNHAYIAAEDPAVRGLFEYSNDDNIISFIPTEVEIWRKG